MVNSRPVGKEPDERIFRLDRLFIILNSDDHTEYTKENNL